MIDFTDTELNVILTLTNKADPMSLIADIQSIRTKILNYAQEQQQAQMAEAAEAAPVEEPVG